MTQFGFLIRDFERISDLICSVIMKLHLSDIIWIFFEMIKNILFMVCSVVFSLNAHADVCKSVNDGIYVSDESYPRSGPGKMSKVIENIKAKGLNQDVLGTTGQFSYAFTVHNGEVIVSKSLGNILDESYESNSSAASAVLDVTCNGALKISFEFNKYYYPDFIKIGVIPKNKGKLLKRKLSAVLQGRILDDGNFIISQCSEKSMSYHFDDKKWGEWEMLDKSSSLFGLCSYPQNDIFFNISSLVTGKKGWRF